MLFAVPEMEGGRRKPVGRVFSLLLCGEGVTPVTDEGNSPLLFFYLLTLFLKNKVIKYTAAEVSTIVAPADVSA